MPLYFIFNRGNLRIEMGKRDGRNKGLTVGIFDDGDDAVEVLFGHGGARRGDSIVHSISDDQGQHDTTFLKSKCHFFQQYRLKLYVLHQGSTIIFGMHQQ